MLVSEAFDIGYLIPGGATRVKVVISLEPGSASIKVFAVGPDNDLHSGRYGGATLRRDFGATLLLKVPAGVHVVLIASRAEP